MNIGIIGLGKIGKGFYQRLAAARYNVVGYDIQQEHAEVQYVPLETLVQHSNIIFLLLPAGQPVRVTIETLTRTARAQTIVIDAGNSNFQDSIQHAQTLAAHGMTFLDCGTSGGVTGAQEGYSLTIGGDKNAFEQCEKLFQTLAQKNGYAHVGPVGAGHYVKMVHNGIEYGMLEALAEGFMLLHSGSYKHLDIVQITRVWSRGSIIQSRLVELSHQLFIENSLEKASGVVDQTGTALWMIEDARKNNVPTPAIHVALNVRLNSQTTGGNYATKYIAAMRNLFGGHRIKEQ